MALRELARAHLESLRKEPVSACPVSGRLGMSGPDKTILDTASPDKSDKPDRMDGSDKPDTHRCACGSIGSIGVGWFLRQPDRASWYCGPCFELLPTDGRA